MGERLFPKQGDPSHRAGNRMTRRIAAAGAGIALAAGGVVTAGNALTSGDDRVDNPKHLPAFPAAAGSEIAETQTGLTEAKRASNERIASAANSFVEHTLGRNQEGTPDIDVAILADRNNDQHFVAQTAWESNLDDGSLANGVRLQVTARGSDRTLDVTVNGLFVNGDRTAYDLERSNITRLAIHDDEAQVYGNPTIVEYTEYPDDEWEASVVSFSPEDNGGQVFDTAYTRNPDDYTLGVDGTLEVQRAVEAAYGLGR